MKPLACAKLLAVLAEHPGRCREALELDRIRLGPALLRWAGEFTI